MVGTFTTGKAVSMGVPSIPRRFFAGSCVSYTSCDGGSGGVRGDPPFLYEESDCKVFSLGLPLPLIFRNFRGLRVLSEENLAPYTKSGAAPLDLSSGVVITEWVIAPAGWGPAKFYYDASRAFVLAVGGQPAACIAFDVDVEPRAVMIKQIQGKRGKENLLAPFRWERLLVNFVTEWARRLGFREVLVQPAVKNKYYYGFRRETFLLRYDVTAKRAGFRYDASREWFVKRLV